MLVIRSLLVLLTIFDLSRKEAANSLQTIISSRSPRLFLRGGSSATANDDYLRTRAMWLSGDASSNSGTPLRNSTSVSQRRVHPHSAGSQPTLQPAQSRSSGKRGFMPQLSRKMPTTPKTYRTASGGRVQQACTVTLAMLSKDRFAVLTQHMHKNVTDTCKRMVGRYDPEHKRWTFPVLQYDRVLAALQQLQFGQSRKIKLVPVPDAIFESITRACNETARIAANNSPEDTEPLYASIPEGLRSKLMPFQCEGVRFGLGRGGRLLIGDEMGLGKTIQAIAIAAAYLSDWPLLVVCPSSMRVMWSQELCKWLPDMVEPSDINMIFTGKDKIDQRSVTILSYDLFAKFAAEIEQHGFGVIIADESHYLKNSQARRTKCIVPMLKEAKRAVLLTGTPALARPVELFNLVHALHPQLFANYYDFVHRYCDAKPGPFGLETGGSSNLEELHLVLQEHAMIRRLKREVLDQLPAKRRQRVLLKVEEKELRQITAQLEQLKDLDKVASDDSVDAGERMSAEARKKALIMKNYVDTGTAKLPALKEYVSDLLDGGAKFLVFAHHREVLDALECTVKAKKANYIRIDGSTPSSQRQELVSQFQTKHDVRVAVLSVTAAGTGLTLTAAHTVVFAELHWTPGVLLQAEDRVHRIGQQSSVNIHYLLAQGTCDDLIWDSIAHKMRVVGRALDGQTANLGATRSTVSQSISTTTKGTNGSDPTQSSIDFNRSGGTAPTLKWDAPEAMQSNVSALREDFGTVGLEPPGEDKIGQLLTHPVVLAAMENPKLEKLFEQLVEGAGNVTDEDLLAEHDHDDDVRVLFQTVRSILNGSASPESDGVSVAELSLSSVPIAREKRTAMTRPRKSSEETVALSEKPAETKKRRINLRGGACSSFAPVVARFENVAEVRPEPMEVDSAPNVDVHQLMEELERTKRELQTYRQAVERQAGNGSHPGFCMGQTPIFTPEVPSTTTTTASSVSGSIPLLDTENLIVSRQGQEGTAGMSRSRLDSLPTFSAPPHVVNESECTAGGAVNPLAESDSGQRTSVPASTVVRWTEKLGSSMVVEQVPNVIRRTEYKSGSSMVVEQLPSGTTIDEIDSAEANQFAPDCQVEVEEVDGVERFKGAKFTVGGSTEMPAHLVNSTEITADVVNTDLHQLAKDFPSCAKYLMHEFDNRRLLTDTGHTLGEDKIRRLMTKVAARTQDADSKLMALYIREKKCGASGPLALGQVSAELDIPDNQDAVNALKQCSCRMDRSMKCHCNRQKLVGSGMVAGASMVSDLAELPQYDAARYSEFKLKTVRKRMGNVTIEPLKVVEAVQAMGGVECVEGKQSVKGKGWTAVAAEMGIDIDKNRDAGYQLRKVYMAYHYVQKPALDVTDKCSSVDLSATTETGDEDEDEESVAGGRKLRLRRARNGQRGNEQAGRVEKKKRGRRPKGASR